MNEAHKLLLLFLQAFWCNVLASEYDFVYL